ncbi:MAG: hypothetical protein ACJAVN_001379 [Roseivirga sp.]|jgi:hypothetical protein
MIRRNLILKIAEWLLTLFKYGAIALVCIGLWVIIFKPQVFSELAIDLNSHLFTQMDIDIPVLSEELTDSADWLSSAKFTVSTLKLKIEGNRQLRIISFFVSVFIVAIFYIIVSQLLGLVKSVKLGSPFINQNVKRIRTIGLILITMELFLTVGKVVLNSLLEGSVAFENRLSSAHINIGTEILDNWFFIGLMILVIAEVFKQGIAMKQEQELTI